MKEQKEQERRNRDEEKKREKRRKKEEKEDKKKLSGSRELSTPSSTYFTVSLEDLPAREDGKKLPLFIEVCVEYIEKYGECVERFPGAGCRSRICEPLEYLKLTLLVS